MTSDELKEAMAKGFRVTWKDSSEPYRVSGIIMRYTGRYVFQAELKSLQANSVLVVKADEVRREEVQ